MKFRILLILFTFSCTLSYSQDIKSILDSALFSYEELTQNDSIQKKFIDRFSNKKVFLIAEQHELAINPEYQLFFLKFLYEFAGVRNIFTEKSYGNALLIDKYLRTGNINYLKSSHDYKYELSRNYWIEIYKWNQTLHPEQRINVIGIGRFNWSLIAPIYYCIPSNKIVPTEIEKEINTIRKLFNSNPPPNYYSDDFDKKDNQKLRKILKKKLAKYPNVKSYFGSNYKHVREIVNNPAAYKPTDASMLKNFNSVSENISGNIMIVFGTYHCFLQRDKHTYDPLAKLINESEPFRNKVFSSISYCDNCTSARGITTNNEGFKPFIDTINNDLLIDEAFDNTDFSILILDNLPKNLIKGKTKYANLLFLMKDQEAIY